MKEKEGTEMTKKEDKLRYKIGRPPKYETVEELTCIIEDYFTSIRNEEGTAWIRPPTVSGLSFALGMSTRNLLRYESKDDFRPIITRAKQVCEFYLEENAIVNNAKACISLISMNFGRYEKRGIGIGDIDDIQDVDVPQRQTREEWEANQQQEE